MSTIAASTESRFPKANGRNLLLAIISTGKDKENPWAGIFAK
jgi:hypothetical protein